jgi:ABC-type uncharacterized transport system substrate-binding protein
MNINMRHEATGRRKTFCFALCALLVALGLSAEAQQPKLPRIGFLFGASPSANAGRIEAFRQGLRELGYVEGKNIAIEYRYADGKSERIPDLAAKLVNFKVDLVVTSQTPTVLAIKKVSSTIPIVFFLLSFPVENGIVASFARPGGNATGLTVLSEELNGKRLELLKDASPTIKRVGVLSNPDNPTQPLEWKGIQACCEC